MRNNKIKVVVICGPTASGKTNLALQLAKELPKANILSVDSRQVYKDLDIITGKDTPQNLPKNIKIFGHDIFNANENANIADFIRYSKKIIQDSQDSKIPLIIVGGTGLYLKALTQKLSDILIPPDIKLRRKLEKFSLEKLQTLLKKENPKKFFSLNHSDLMNPRRLVRYLEIAGSKNKTVQTQNSLEEISFHWIGLLPNKKNIKNSIHHRVLARLNGGAVNEVKHLLKNFPDKNLHIYSSLGVSYIIEYLGKKISKKTLVEKWTNAEGDYARRQVVWFKKQPGIVWYDKDIDKIKLAGELSKIYLKNA